MPTSIASASRSSKPTHDRGVELSRSRFPTGRCTSARSGALPYSRCGSSTSTSAARRPRLPPGKIGVVTMHGPGVFSGYVTGAPMRRSWSQGGSTAATWVASMRTGTLDHGRAKDLIIRSGHNIDPLGVEEVLRPPRRRDGGPGRRARCLRRELPVAYVQLRPAPRPAGRARAVGGRRTPERARAVADLHRRRHSADRAWARSSSRRCAPTRPNGRPPDAGAHPPGRKLRGRGRVGPHPQRHLADSAAQWPGHRSRARDAAGQGQARSAHAAKQRRLGGTCDQP
jgi:hypothetical protein